MSSPPLVIVDPHFHMWTAARPNANLGDILAKVPLYDAAAGTWVSYNSIASVQAITAWAAGMGLRGVFVFDASMDTKAFDVRNAVANAADAVRARVR